LDIKGVDAPLEDKSGPVEQLQHNINCREQYKNI
jgi:hypothetical protein